MHKDIEDLRGACADAAAMLIRASERLVALQDVGLAREAALMAESILNIANDDPMVTIKLAIPGGELGKYERERAERRSLEHYLSTTQTGWLAKKGWNKGSWGLYFLQDNREHFHSAYKDEDSAKRALEEWNKKNPLLKARIAMRFNRMV